MQMNILEAKNTLSEPTKSAQAGVDVVIANRGQPVVRLVPTESKSKTKQNRNLLVWLQRSSLPTHAQKSASEYNQKRYLDEWPILERFARLSLMPLTHFGHLHLAPKKLVSGSLLSS
jgi:antitoxin (DNA-binding transcriptional repressor) of toxin-antitoxin stability system